MAVEGSYYDTDDTVSDVDNYDWTNHTTGIGELRDALMEHLPLQQSPSTKTKLDGSSVDQQETNPAASGGRPRKPSIILETANDTLLRLSNEFVSIIEKDADTLVYIGTPPQAPGQDKYDYEYIKRLFERPHLMKSSTLKGLKSSKFDKFLGPMSARTERRLKKQGLHRLVARPEEIKYYVDLSPILSDDEALIQITELSVPHGALNWHKLAKDYCIPPSHVCGRDQLNLPPKPVYALVCSEANEHLEEAEEQQEKVLPESASNLPQSGRNGNDLQHDESKPKPHEYDLALEEEYTPLRHHTAIVRLLHSITGTDPKLNSAAKAWTFCMLAKYFDCAQSPAVSHPIVTWFLAENNSHFIQANPEIAYRMAMATQSVWLMKCTFAILVGRQVMHEATIDFEAATTGQPKTRLATQNATILDDDEIDRIDHAASALTQRIKNVFDEIAVFPGAWNSVGTSGSEMEKLNKLRFDKLSEETMLKHTRDLIRDYIRRMIYMTLSESYNLGGKVRGNLSDFKGVKNYDRYDVLPRPLRLFTQNFWHILRQEEYSRDYTDTLQNREIWQRTLTTLQREGVIQDIDITYVSRKKVFEALEEINGYLYSRVRPTTPDIASPTKKIKLTPDTHEWMDAPTASFEPDTSSMQTHQLMEPSRLAIAAKEAINHISSNGLYRKVLSPSTDVISAPTEEGEEEEDKEWEDVFSVNRMPGEFSTQPVYMPIRQEPRDAHTVRATAAATEYASSVRAQTIGQVTKHFKQMSLSAAYTSSSQSRLEAADSPSHLRQRNNITTALDLSQSDERFVPRKFVAILDGDSRPKRSRNDIPISPKTKLQPYHTSQAQEFPDEDQARTPTPFDKVANTDAPAETSASSYWFAPGKSSTSSRSFGAQSRRGFGTDRSRNTPTIDPFALLKEIGTNIYCRLHEIVTPGYVSDKSCELDIPVNEISTLLCLSEAEWKYLPLWADGLDDGTGGVFNDGVEIPDAPEVEMGGFRGGAMGIIPGVGSSIGGSIAGSEFEDIRTEVGISTVGKASRYATDGTATETVISLDE